MGSRIPPGSSGDQADDLRWLLRRSIYLIAQSKAVIRLADVGEARWRLAVVSTLLHRAGQILDQENGIDHDIRLSVSNDIKDIRKEISEAHDRPEALDALVHRVQTTIAKIPYH